GPAVCLSPTQAALGSCKSICIRAALHPVSTPIGRSALGPPVDCFAPPVEAHAADQLFRRTTHSAIGPSQPPVSPAAVIVACARSRQSAASARERSSPKSAG